MGPGSIKKKHENLIGLGEGIKGIINNRNFCYMNAFMQCLAPIEPLRDHYLAQVYAQFKEMSTKRHSFDFVNSLYMFYKGMYRLKDPIIDLVNLKDAVTKKFHPI